MFNPQDPISHTIAAPGPQLSRSSGSADALGDILASIEMIDDKNDSQNKAENGSEPTRVGRVATAIRTRILVEQLEPGVRLGSEADLAEAYETSRPAVREALRLLDSEGFIQVKRGRYGGVFVSYPRAADLGVWLAQQIALNGTTGRTLFQFRRMLDLAATEHAVANATSVQLAELQELSQSTDPKHHTQFHLALARASGNELLEIVMSAVISGLAEYGAYDVITETEMPASTKAHARIFDCASARDPEGAVASMKRHLDATEQVLARSGRLDEPIINSSAW